MQIDVCKLKKKGGVTKCHENAFGKSFAILSSETKI